MWWAGFDGQGVTLAVPGELPQPLWPPQTLTDRQHSLAAQLGPKQTRLRSGARTMDGSDAELSPPSSSP